MKESLKIIFLLGGHQMFKLFTDLKWIEPLTSTGWFLLSNLMVFPYPYQKLTLQLNIPEMGNFRNISDLSA